MKTLVITPRIVGDVTVVDLEGPIHLGADSAELHRQIQILGANGTKKVLLNMEKVTHIDSSGLGELVWAHKMLENEAGELKMFGLSDRVHQLMTMTKLLTVFELYESEKAALESFDQPTEKAETVTNVV